MPKLFKRKTGKLTLGDAFGIALFKSFGERLLTPFVGNGTFLSGAVKIGGAMALYGLIGGRIGDLASTSLIVDGSEDIIRQLLGSGGFGGFVGGAGQGQNIV